MTRLYRVALLGFSPHERTTLAGYFRMAANRVPRYEQVARLDEAELMVADADHGPSEQLVLATDRLPDTLFIGTRAPQGAAAWLPRPLDPLRVLRELDSLVAQSGGLHGPATTSRTRTVIQPPRRTRPTTIEAALGGSAAAVPPPAPAPVVSPPAPAQAATEEASQEAAQEPPPAAPAPAATELPEVLELDLHLPEERVQALAPPPVAPMDEPPAPPAPAVTAVAPSPVALLVDDSEIALRFLQTRLARFGISCHAARDSSAALAMLPQLEPDFVFLDMELGEGSALDGLALARRIKTEWATRVPPMPVFMVTAHHGQLDRVRATLAGCDALLPKPLADAELERLLARHGVRRAVAD